MLCFCIHVALGLAEGTYVQDAELIGTRWVRKFGLELARGAYLGTWSYVSPMSCMSAVLLPFFTPFFVILFANFDIPDVSWGRSIAVSIQ